jgi:signal transduction histidine kinase
MKFLGCCLLLSFGIYFKGYALTEPLLLNTDIQQHHLGSQMEYMIDSAYSIQDQYWHRKLLHGTFNPVQDEAIKMTSHFPIVLRFTLQTSTLENDQYVLDVQHADLDYLQLVLLEADSVVFQSKPLGDLLPFKERYFDYRFFAVPISLKPDRQYTCLLVLHKPDRVLTARIGLYQHDFWESVVNESDLKNGVVFGLFISFIVIGLLLFITLRQIQFFYYSFYAVSVFLLVSSIFGYTYQYIFPDYPWIQDKWMIFIQIFGLIFLNLYAFEFLSIARWKKKWLMVRNGLIVVYVFFILILIIFLKVKTEWEVFFGYLLHGVESMNFFFLLSMPIFIYFTSHTRESLIFFISYSFVGISLFYSIFSFLVPSLKYLMLMDVLPFGLLAEMMILVFYMVINYKSVLDRKFQLESLLEDQRRVNQRAFIQGQERERNDIALFIHDHIISKVNLIQRMLENPMLLNTDQKRKQYERLQSLSHDLRILSHDLMPEAISKLGLERALSELLNDYNELWQVSYYFSLNEISIEQEDELNIYRICQELLKNAERHSKASCISLQLIADAGRLFLTFEDDGVGLKLDEVQIGLGFRGIAFRVDLMGGEIKYESALGEGLLVMISVPYD